MFQRSWKGQASAQPDEGNDIAAFGSAAETVKAAGVEVDPKRCFRLALVKRTASLRSSPPVGRATKFT
jgi:hypothetical protein